MAFPFDVHLTDGIPDSGTGSVYTLNTIAAAILDGDALIDVVNLVSEVSTLETITNSVAVRGTLNLVNSIGTVGAVTTIGTVNAVTTVSAVGTVAAITAVGTITPGTASTSLGKAEDAVHTTGDTGIMVLAVRQDSQVDFAADGDYVPFSIDANGALRVTGGGGGTEYTEDVAAAADPLGQMLIAVRRDTLSTSEVTADGDNIALKATNKGKLHVAAELRSGDTVIDVGSGTGGTATLRTILDSSQLGSLGAVTSASAVPVVLATDHATVPGGGDIAHDAADSGNPLKVGAKAVSTIVGQTPVTSNDRTNLYAGRDGVLITRPYCNLEDIIDSIRSTTATTAVQIFGSVSSQRAYITSIIIDNKSVTSTSVDVLDGATQRMRLPAPVGGVVKDLIIPLRCSENSSVSFALADVATTVTVTMIGFRSKI